jgi:lipopolysaccharide transport system ATP-binding protein
MTDLAIRAVDLGKRYRIGDRASYLNLRDTVAGAAAALFSPRRGERERPAERPEGNGAAPWIPDRDGYFWALKDVCCEIRQGEVLGVIGPNGAGKSTFLKIIARITRPTTGYVEVTGRVGSLLEVGTGFNMELTGRDNVYLSGAILGMKRREIDRKFDEIVAFSEVEAFIDTPVKHYSHGMYVRIAFAVAAHLQAEILLVDEVLAAGDAAFQQKCIDKMRALANDGRTILIASHQLQTLHQLCPRSVRLEHGALKQIAETSVATAAHLASQSSRQMGD